MSLCPHCGRYRGENHQCLPLREGPIEIDLDDAATIDLDLESFSVADQPPEEAVCVEEPPVRRRFEQEGLDEADQIVDFSFVVSRAWSCAGGFRQVFWSGAVRISIFLLLLGFVVRTIYFLWLSGMHDVIRITGFSIVFFLEASITCSLIAGLVLICIENLEGFLTTSSKVFGFLLHGPFILMTFLLGLCASVLGFACFIVPGVFLGAMAGFSCVLVAEGNLFPWPAIKRTIATTWPHIKTLTPLFWFSVLFVILGIVPFTVVRFAAGINKWWVYFLILPAYWTLPFGFLVFAETYRCFVSKEA